MSAVSTISDLSSRLDAVVEEARGKVKAFQQQAESSRQEIRARFERFLPIAERIVAMAREKLEKLREQLRGPDGRRPVFGGAWKFQNDPHWRDYLLFYEYFHGDDGAGLGASHQTGWTGMIARVMHLFATLAPEHGLEGGKRSYFERAVRSTPGASAVSRP